MQMFATVTTYVLVSDNMHSVSEWTQWIFDMQAAIAQLGERQTEDLKVPGSIPGRGIRY